MDKTQYRKHLHSFYGIKHFDNVRQFFIAGEMIDGVCCYYCGGLATTRDHSPALRVVMRILEKGDYDEFEQLTLVVVPACRACNGNLSAKPLLTLEERRAYIHTKYPTRLETSPISNWSALELNELGPTLRGAVKLLITTGEKKLKDAKKLAQRILFGPKI
jgi:hypothetical protein